MFTPEEIRMHITQLEREQSEKAVDISEEDELYCESQIAAAERVRRFTSIKELLTGLSCLDGALLASRFLSLMLLRGGLGAVMSPALMRGTL